MQQPQPGWSAWTAVKLSLVVAVVIAGAFAIDWVLRAQNYPVRSVRFEGPFRHVSRAELEAAAMGSVRGNFFLVDLEAVKQRVESLPWIHRAWVRRRFPNEIHIEFAEQQLVAGWHGREWLNSSGEVVRVPMATLPAAAPVLAGPDGTSAQVLAAYRLYAPQVALLGLRLNRLTLTPRGNWQLEVGSVVDPATVSFVVRLDGEQPQQRWQRFARAYRQAFATALTDLRVVDLRYTNGFAVEWRTPTAAVRAAATPPAAATANSGVGGIEG